MSQREKRAQALKQHLQDETGRTITDDELRQELKARKAAHRRNGGHRHRQTPSPNAAFRG